jgi:hypothetical protein
MMMSWPDCQSAGVATRCVSVSWRESSTRRISAKFRPVLASMINSTVLRGSMMKTDRTVAVSDAFGWIIP